MTTHLMQELYIFTKYILGTIALFGYWMPTILLASSNHGVVLQYHHISDTMPRATSLAPDAFRDQLAILDKENFKVWSLPKLVNALLQKDSIPGKVVVITFDDAYSDIYHQAAPVLRGFNFPFTVFVSTDYVDRKQKGYLTWDQLRELKQQGATIANHTLSHPHLLRSHDNESESDWKQRVKREIVETEARIQAETGDSFQYFAYPYGEANEKLMAWVKDWGFVGFGQQSGALDLQALQSGLAPRFPFNQNYADLTAFRLKASSLPFGVIKEEFERTVWETPQKPKLVVHTSIKLDNRLACYLEGKLIPVVVLTEYSFKVIANESIPIGRSRYNCTMPSRANPGRYHWYSKQWIRKQNDGKWYPEP